MNDAQWRIRHLRAWAAEMPYLWFNLLLIAGTAEILFIGVPLVGSKPSDTWLRTWGLCLQVLGIYTVWKDLAANASTFHISIIGSFTDWLRRAWPDRVVHASAHMSAGANATAFGTANLTWTMDPNQPIDERVRRLEGNVEALQKGQEVHARRADRLERDLKAGLDQEQSAREVMQRTFEDKLKDTLVGNFGVLVFGLFWLLVGTVLTAVGPEIALARHGMWHDIVEAMVGKV